MTTSATGTQISEEDIAVLHAFIGSADSLVSQVQATFNEVVTFVKTVTFQ